MTLPDPVRLEASIRSRIERLADEHTKSDPEARQQWIERLRRELAYRRLLAGNRPGPWQARGALRAVDVENDSPHFRTSCTANSNSRQPSMGSARVN